MKKVLLSQKISNEGMDVLKGKAEIVVAPDPSESTISRLIEDVNGVILRTTSRITRNMILTAPNLEVISRTGVGVDNIDIKTASEHGIFVCNLPGVNYKSVAEHAASLLIALAKALPYLDSEVRNGNWGSRNTNRPVELSNKTLGVIGFGRIGSYLATIMQKGFGMKILAHDPYVVKSKKKDIEVTFCNLEVLLRRSDFISIHLPATSQTKGMLTQHHLHLMKSTAFLINTARGVIIDERALVEVLRKKSIAGAGLDVFEKEPLPSNHPLTSLDNIILSPHVGALTKECVIRAAVDAAQAIVDVFIGCEPKNVYNSKDLKKAT